MAVISGFFHDDRACARHRKKVECGWQIVKDSRGDLLQLATFGSDDRQSEKKVSQTVQLDRTAARQLLDVLKNFAGDA